jgi:hypothetical protein
LEIINKYGNFNYTERLLLTLCYINGNHFKVIYEKDTKLNNMYNNIFIKDGNINIKTEKVPNTLNFNYVNNPKKINSYEEIKDFIIHQKYKGELKYPNCINNITNKKIKYNKKRNFKKAYKSYDYDFKLNRLTKSIKIRNAKNKYEYKTFIIPYEFEKINILHRLHINSFHKGINILYKHIQDSKFWWDGIYKGACEYQL